MEDAHTAVLNLADPSADNSKANPTKLSFFGVFDGHGGEKVALFAGENIHSIIMNQDSFKAGDYAQGLRDGFLATDRAILNGTPGLVFIVPCPYCVRTWPGPRPVTANLACSPKIPGMRTKFQAALPVSAWLPATRSMLYVMNPPGLLPRPLSPTCQANAGDSRGVLGIKGRAKPLSQDHKPQLESMFCPGGIRNLSSPPFETKR